SVCVDYLCFFFSSRRRHTTWPRDWSSDVCSSDLVGIVVVEALVQQHPPSHLIPILAARRLRHRAELFVRALPLLEPPEAFGAEVGVAAVRQRLEAALGLRRMSMLAQRPAVCWCRGTDGYSPCQRENRKDDGEPHLSSCSCTFASSTNASVNCFL